MNQSYITMILENIRLSHTERLLQEAQTDLELIRGQRLINESVLAINNELSYLLQENMDDQQQGGIGSHIRNNWGKYATGGALTGMAHAGAFGSNAKHLVDNAGSALKEGAGRAMDHTTNAMNDTAKFYEKDIAPGAAGGLTQHAKIIKPDTIIDKPKELSAADKFAAEEGAKAKDAFIRNEGRLPQTHETLHQQSLQDHGNWAEKAAHNTENWFDQHGEDIGIGAGTLGLAGLSGLASYKYGSRRRP